MALPPTASHVRKLQKRVRFLDRVKTSALAAKAAVFKRKRKTQGISLGALVRSPFARGFGARDGTSVLTFFCVCQEDALPQLESFLSTASRAKAAPQFLSRASAVVHKGARIKRFAAETVRTCVRPSPCASAKLRWLVACRCTCVTPAAADALRCSFVQQRVSGRPHCRCDEPCAGAAAEADGRREHGRSTRAKQEEAEMRHACWLHRCSSSALARACAPPPEAATWTGLRWSRGRRAKAALVSAACGCHARRSTCASAAAELASWPPP